MLFCESSPGSVKVTYTLVLEQDFFSLWAGATYYLKKYSIYALTAYTLRLSVVFDGRYGVCFWFNVCVYMWCRLTGRAW